MRNGRLVGLLVLMFLASAVGAGPVITRDIVYGHKDGMALTYDAFAPEVANGAAIIYMVSGGWFSVWQSPEDRVSYFESLLSAGFTVFAVHHGSAPRYRVPEAVSDMRAAVRHIRKHARDHGVDATRLGVWGGSAGGHLSLMLGLNPEGVSLGTSGQGFRQLGPRYFAEDSDDARVAAVVAYYPPVDIRPRVGPSERFPALDFPKDQAASISPILFVTPDDPPVKLIHGDADALVPLADSQLLDAELTRIGVEHEVLVIEGGDHGFRNPAHNARANEAMVAWFKRFLSAPQ